MITNIIKKIKEFDSHINVIRKQGTYKNKPLMVYRLDYLMTFLRYGASPKDYTVNEMYKLNSTGKDSFITWKRHNKIEPMLNDYSKDDSFIENKGEFLNKMESFIKRDWIWSKNNIDESTILDFMMNHNTVFYKPSLNTKGQGIRKLSNVKEDVKFVIDEYRKGIDFVLEDKIIQHSYLQKMNPYAVNTVRVMTLLDKEGKAHVIACILKASCNKKFVDNFAMGGFMYPVDLKTGIVSGEGKSYSTSKKSVIHPVSKVPIVGFAIPGFEKMKREIKNAAEEYQEFRYIGWDIAITEDGYDIVEANLDPCPCLCQCDGVGRYHLLKRMLK